MEFTMKEQYITPKTVLLSFGKTLAHIQKTNKQPKKATYYELPIQTIMVHGYELMNAYYDNTDDQKEVKNILWTLQRHGYVTSKIVQRTTTIRGNAKIQYKQRLWKLTDKGLNKLKEIANKTVSC